MEMSVSKRTPDAAQIRLAALIDSLPLGLVITDEDDSPQLTNRQLVRMLHYNSDKTLAQQLDDLGLKKICSECRRDNNKCKPREIKFDDFVYKIIVTPVVFEGKVRGTIVLLENITQQKMLERTREEFFATASHELRTPLTAIRGSADMLLKYYSNVLQGHDDMTELINDIYSSCVALIGLVNDFLDASRLEMGRVKVVEEEVDVMKLIKEVVHGLRINAADKKIILGYEVEDENLPSALADYQRSRQVLVNLIGNAVKFTKHGGVVVDAQKKDKVIEIRVNDSGPGIPRDRQSLLFKKFQQAGESYLRREMAQGSGMGLYISRLLARHMKGDLILEKSEVDKGSTFLFTLPVAKELKTQSEKGKTTT
ncbi:MAG: PAS domain-containing sensor histidine kinase [Candidatus Andersenbacteria bacterium]|nr:PAS domain-containing sensor histidine kinase [bacterium]MDZ4225591.1 PAS domain-containing sensor histidine kinase [Candidatus Andersenbacteria bacterium]